MQGPGMRTSVKGGWGFPAPTALCFPCILYQRVPEIKLVLGGVQEQRTENQRSSQTLIEIRATQEALSCVVKGALRLRRPGRQRAWEARLWVLTKLWVWSPSASGEHQVRGPTELHAPRNIPCPQPDSLIVLWLSPQGHFLREAFLDHCHIPGAPEPFL